MNIPLPVSPCSCGSTLFQLAVTGAESLGRPIRPALYFDGHAGNAMQAHWDCTHCGKRFLATVRIAEDSP